MSALVNALLQAFVSAIQNIAAQTSTVTSSGFDTLGYDGQLQVIQSVGTVSGTTPTLNGKIQHSIDNGSTDPFADITGATFTQVTASNATQAITLDRNATKRYIRVVGTIAGTTPSFTCGWLFNAFKKVRP